MISENASNVFPELDLDRIRMKLMHVESGESWSAAHAAAVEVEYRRFLYLMKAFPDEQVAPSVDVDTFWHYHILDTAKYAIDCERVFGYFLHHYPYIGLRGGDDAEVHRRSGERMRELYEQTFGAATGAGQAYCAVTAETSYCAVTAKSAYCAVVAKPAYCAAVAKSAYCAATEQPAYCAVVAKAAYCAASAKPAYCAGSKPAYCAASAKPAYCAASSKSAYCAATAKPAYCAASEPAARPAKPASAYCAAKRAGNRVPGRAGTIVREFAAAA